MVTTQARRMFGGHGRWRRGPLPGSRRGFALGAAAVSTWAVSFSIVAPSVVRADTATRHSGSVQAAFARLDDDGSRFGIRRMRWVPAAGGLPGYEFVLGCLDCDGATYDDTGTLTNARTLARIPTSWILRVPENYRHRLVAQVPPGQFDHTFLRPYLTTLLSDGYATAVMDHPRPGFADFPYDQFIRPPFRTTDYGRSYERSGRILKRILEAVGRRSEGSYFLGHSRGVITGGGALAGSEADPFDGSVLSAGSDGELNDLQAMITSIRTDGLIPLTHLASPFDESAVLDEIGRADPDYRAQVLAGTASALDYDVTRRPREVQAAWRALAYKVKLQGPTIVIQGLHDTTEWPDGTIKYAKDVVAAESQDNLRLFLFKEMGHSPFDPPAPPTSLFVDAVHALDRWSTDGAEPGPLVVAAPIGTQSSCTALGFGSDPRACFDAVFGRGF